MSPPVALISGITGQTGAYLAHRLLQKGHKVVGGTRDASSSDRSRLKRLGVDGDLELLSLAPADFRSVIQCVRKVRPDQIYYLAGQTSVGLSFEQPFESIESIAVGTLNLLEAIRLLGEDIRFFSAGSSECFGNSLVFPLTEESPMRPVSPYAVAKCAAFWSTVNYRQAYGLFACTGILSNHESPLRPDRFVTRKIISSLRSIQAGDADKLTLGNLDIWRDWGWAPDYVEAIDLIMSADNADDYLIASGHTHSLREFLSIACRLAGLDEDQIISSDPGLYRPSELNTIELDPSKIRQQLGWSSTLPFETMVERLYHEELF
ncbi:GDP-mannose 4,6-dehydratase [Synechococcus sp. CS-1324]|uniref:GDP-mannose 4,6-dehydratase n=1 Tax=Synechococcus sp. CS-1324 TaxID=2847980 RepID=UPI000DB277D3|nr:GDP-mannose 4,6-dehydratase [Synechococcus sp. CS-1324]MCT0229478.1 GDP-mannose 4,6-dehydratase [Synechococcus sp. CS-1324]PZV04862.1 MAG: GDP-mannose 4,6-dehydratase [Cyanobium sp.]